MNFSIPVFILIGFMSLTYLNSGLAMSEKTYQPVSGKDSLNAVKSIKGFLKWYKANYKKSSGFRLVGSDESGNYFVDQKACELYLKHLKSSAYISDTYLQQWRKYFSEMNKNFKDNPQNEGPPEGFDYDLISGTQEPDLFYNPTENHTFTIVKVEKSKIVIQSTDIWEHQFTLSKSGVKWKVDDIKILGYAPENVNK
ncbi:MAG: hypothetical protein IPM42_14520 [Saprospiraceae bacterium]|nr:hypothetical protein [Saprospiraceae bacterium]